MSSAFRWRNAAWLGGLFLLSTILLAASRTVPRLRVYRNEDLEFKMKIPKAWIRVEEKLMVGFKSQKDGAGASIGVFREPNTHMPVQLMAHKYYLSWKRPKDWSQRLMRIGTLGAMEVEMHPDGDATRRLLFYFIDAQIGHWGYYVIECQAPADQWAEHKALFQTLVQSFTPL